MLGSNPSADSVAKTEVGRLICAPLPSLSQPLGIGTKATNPGVAGAKPPLLHPLQTLNSHQIGQSSWQTSFTD